MTALLLLFQQAIFWYFTNANWTQDFGDASSTSFVRISNTAKTLSNWNYTVKNEYSASFFYNSPAVSETGMTFIPFLEVPEYWLQVRAVSSTGQEVWVANWIGADESCSVVDLSNTLYDSQHNMVIVGWFCTAGGAYHQKAGRVVALNASTGSRIWQSPQLKMLDSAKLSMSSDTVFFVGGYDCGRDNPTGYSSVRHPKRSKKNDTIIAAIDLLNGSIRWTQSIYHGGCDGQVKVGSLNNSVILLVPFNLPSNGPYLTGELLAVQCFMSPFGCQQIWQKNLRLSYDAKFAFTSDGKFVFGSYGFAGNPDLIFGLETLTGNLKFSNRGYCNPGSYPGSPSVDEMNQAYYSCGNLVFTVDTTGQLLWKSHEIGQNGYVFDTFFKQTPSLHLDKDLIFFSDTNSTSIHSLSMKDGKLQKSYDILSLLNNSVCAEPPIIVGDSLYLIKVTKYIDYFLFSILL